MTTDERFKQLEDVMVEILRKQNRTVEELVQMREGQSELNTKIVRVENRIERVENRIERVQGKLEDVSRNVLELRCDTEKYQQETTAGLVQIIDLIRNLE
jgi:predicted  nucleic acid-binding Zn-ribbon protein